MKITYLNCDGKHKLFSFHRHHYNTAHIEGKSYMIDGGFDKPIVIENLKQEEFLQYAEECKQEFIKHYYLKCKNKLD